MSKQEDQEFKTVKPAQDNDDHAVVVSEIKSSSSIGKKIQGMFVGRRKFVLPILVIAIVASFFAIGFVLLRHNTTKQGEKYALIISGSGKQYGITQDQYKSLLDQASQQKVPADAAKKTIIEAHKYKLVAAQLKIEPTEEEIDRAAEATAQPGQNTLNEWQRLSGYIVAAKGNINTVKKGGYLGALLYYPFDRLYYTEENPSKQALANDEQYALEQATKDRDQLLAKTTSAASLVDKIKQNPKLVAGGGSNRSKILRIDTNGLTYIADESAVIYEPDFVMDAINSLSKQAGISTIRKQSAKVTSAKQDTPIAYYFVSITDVLKPDPNIDNTASKALAAVEVVDNAR